jgi:hypothetical protein
MVGFDEGRGWRRAAAVLAAWAVLWAGTATARDPEAPLRIPLEPLGYQAITPEFLLAGDSELTVDFVDNDHLLVTFGVRRLMKREADSLPKDDDQTIAALLVELPSGKVLARTEWRVHDRLQYLWNLGHGRFLLRVRDRLTVIAPLTAADKNEAFQEIPLLHIVRHIVAILVSSDSDLLTVYTVKRTEGAADNVEVSLDGPAVDAAPVQVNFYRLTHTSEGADGLQVTYAGAIRTREAYSLPMTTGGFLDVLNGGRGTWLFNFDEHAGKVNELLALATSCFPHATFVDHSEFVVFGCRGSDDKQDLAGFNLKGEEMWQQNFTDTHVSPTFSFAPAAGRFALGRTVVSNAIDFDSPLPASLVTAQEVRVYQSYDGREVFRIDLTPVERAGQNFALSPDGMRLAVVRETQVHHAATKDYAAYTQKETGVEVYALPPPTKEDEAAVKRAEAQAPADTGARIDTSIERVSASDAAAAGGASSPAGDSPAAAAAAVDATQQSARGATNGGATNGDGAAEGGSGTGAATGSATGAGNATGTGTTVEGDAEPEAPRKPPTLYGPGEKPEKPQ